MNLFILGYYHCDSDNVWGNSIERENKRYDAVMKWILFRLSSLKIQVCLKSTYSVEVAE